MLLSQDRSFLPASSAHHRERGKARAADTEEIIIKEK